MSEIKYPKTLTASDWDKHKGLLAKSKPTGIGDALKKLQKLHEAIDWKVFDMDRYGMVADLDKNVKTTADYYKATVAPVLKPARDVQELAEQWAKAFAKDKLIPKSAASAAQAVSTAANDYYNALRGFDAVWQAEIKEQRKKLVDNTRKVLAPILTKNLGKIDLFLKDIVTFKAAPTKDNFFKLATGDGGARGYCTALKNWDQLLKDFPDIRDPIFKASAMDTYFKAVEEYGANRDTAFWEKAFVAESLKTKKGGEAILKGHADVLVAEVPNIRKVRGYIEAAIKALA